MRDVNLTVPDYPYGSPCWVDLLVSDVQRAKAFYGELFGWQWLDGDPATGGYTMALLGGHPVAGISRKPDGAPVRSQWTTYLRVGDIEVAERAINTYGGRTLGRPVAIGALSRTLIAVDPGGSYFGVWEPGDLPGSGVLDEPGSLTWNELLTRDYDRVQDFQLAVFGHEFTDETEPGGPRWATAHTGDGNPAFGLAEIDDEWPQEIPPHWVASFATRDVVPRPGPGARARGHAAPGPVRRPVRSRRGAERARGRSLLAPRARPRLTARPSPTPPTHRPHRSIRARPRRAVRARHPLLGRRHGRRPRRARATSTAASSAGPSRTCRPRPAATSWPARTATSSRARWPRTRTTRARSARGRSTSRPTTSTTPPDAPGRPAASSSSGPRTCSGWGASPSAPTQPGRPTACGRPRSTRAPTSSTSRARCAGPSR